MPVTSSCSNSAASVSIIGAGPAGLALAVDLRMHGRNVLVYSHPEHLRKAAGLIASGGVLHASGAIEGSVEGLRLTTSMADVVAFSPIIVFAVPSTGHDTILGELAPFDLCKHTVIALPGNLVSLIMAARGMVVGNVLEGNLSPYLSRMSEDGKTIIVLGKKRRLLIAALRHNNSPEFREQMQSVFPSVELRWCCSVLEVCLANVNGTYHPLMTLMNAGAWDAAREKASSSDHDHDPPRKFRMYRDGLSPSVARAMHATDRVRMDIGAALGFRLGASVDMSNEIYGTHYTDPVDLARNSPIHNTVGLPANGMANRNITEDVPDLLVCWHGLAEKLNIDARPLAVVIGLADMTLGADYLRTGRNMSRLGLEALSGDELVMTFGNPHSSLEMVDAPSTSKEFSEVGGHQSGHRVKL